MVTVPQFPDVPLAPGVPTVLRSVLGVSDRLTGTLTGLRDSATGTFTGAIAGFLIQTSGVSTPISGTLRGVMDGLNNLSGTLSGAISGSVLGALAGSIDPLTGVLSGAVSAAINQLTGLIGIRGGQPSASEFQGVVTDAFVWGIFDGDDAPVIVGDTVAAFENVKDYRISNFPVEGGGFESYNKVETPFDIRMTFTKGGSLAERTAFLLSLEAAAASLALYSVATPERTYLDVNITHFDFQRTHTQGATLLVVDVGLEQVRTTATVTFSNTQADDGAGRVNVGPVQPIEPTPAQAVAFDQALAGAPV